MNMKEGFALLGTELTSPTIDVYIYNFSDHISQLI